MATRTAADTDTAMYPDSDGQPMAETDDHRELMFDVIPLLDEWFADDPDVYVSGNLFVYYAEGEPARVLAPDAFVAFGCEKRRRRVFKTWVEGVFPSVVFEFTSASTSREDMRQKLAIYRDEWKVKEYFLFDPLDEYLDPPLLGYRRTRGQFRPIRMVKGKLTSKELGITLERDNTELILRDAKTGKRLLTTDAKARVAAEKRGAALQAENDRLKAELAALRNNPS